MIQELAAVVTLVAAILFYYMYAQRKKETDRNEAVKAVLLVRADLSMGRGKIISQSMHAAYAAAQNANKNEVAKKWSKCGYKKVTLKVSGEQEMQKIANKCKKKGMAVHKVVDAGRTQVEPNTWTVTFIGPYYESEMDEVTGHLKLY